MKRYLHVFLRGFLKSFSFFFVFSTNTTKSTHHNDARLFCLRNTQEEEEFSKILFCVRIIKWRVLTTTTTTTTTTITTRDGECNRFETTFFFIHNKTRFRRFTISRTTMDEIFYPISTTTTRAFIRRRRA